MQHSKMTGAVGGVHTTIAYVYPTAGDRTGATGFTAEDIGKLALQSSDSSLWMLIGTTPVWRELAAGSSSGIGNVPFTFATTTLILGAVTTGQVLTFAQLDVETVFGSGTMLQVGTVLDPSLFLQVNGAGATTVGSYGDFTRRRITIDDFLLLTVSAVGAVGSGRLFYELR